MNIYLELRFSPLFIRGSWSPLGGSLPVRTIHGGEDVVGKARRRQYVQPLYGLQGRDGHIRPCVLAGHSLRVPRVGVLSPYDPDWLRADTGPPANIGPEMLGSTCSLMTTEHF